MENKKNFYAAIVLVSLFLTLFVTVICLEMSQIRMIGKMIPKEPVELAYDFKMLSDSSFHSNLSDNSCITVTVEDDTVMIAGINTVIMSYNGENHALWVQARYSNQWIFETAFDLDTIFSNVPDNARFIH